MNGPSKLAPVDAASSRPDDRDRDGVGRLQFALDVEADRRIGDVLERGGIGFVVPTKDADVVPGCPFDLAGDVRVITRTRDGLGQRRADALDLLKLPGRHAQGRLRRAEPLDESAEQSRPDLRGHRPPQVLDGGRRGNFRRFDAHPDSKTAGRRDSTAPSVPAAARGDKTPTPVPAPSYRPEALRTQPGRTLSRAPSAPPRTVRR